MKSCFRCHQLKPLDEFYKHSETADGRLGKCKLCTKSDAKNNYHKKTNDTSFVIKERTRSRIKSRGKRRTTEPQCKRRSTVSYREKFPEKYKAHIATQRIKPGNGLENHHWSYRDECLKDVIVLSIAGHAKAHRFLVYDQQLKMYRSLNGNLLDSKQKHEEYINHIITTEED